MEQLSCTAWLLLHCSSCKDHKSEPACTDHELELWERNSPVFTLVLHPCSPPAGFIGAEFEEVYQVVHEGRARFWGMGLFGGSNGYWDSATLKVS